MRWQNWIGKKFRIIQRTQRTQISPTLFCIIVGTFPTEIVATISCNQQARNVHDIENILYVQYGQTQTSHFKSIRNGLHHAHTRQNFCKDVEVTKYSVTWNTVRSQAGTSQIHKGTGAKYTSGLWHSKYSNSTYMYTCAQIVYSSIELQYWKQLSPRSSSRSPSQPSPPPPPPRSPCSIG